jgi:hypothetical protein
MVVKKETTASTWIQTLVASLLFLLSYTEKPIFLGLLILLTQHYIGNISLKFHIVANAPHTSVLNGIGKRTNNKDIHK